MRPKEFDRNSVLENCMHLFWTEGYNGSGVRDIVDRTKVNRYSLYDEFGNKEGILFASLELYIDRYIQWDILSQDESIQEVLFRFFISFFNPSKPHDHPAGCYISTMAMELRETPEMQSFFNAFLDSLGDRFSQLLTTKSKLGASKISVMRQQLTTFYCTCMGMYVIFSLSETEKYIQDNLNLIVKCLNE